MAKAVSYDYQPLGTAPPPYQQYAVGYGDASAPAAPPHTATPGAGPYTYAQAPQGAPVYTMGQPAPAWAGQAQQVPMAVPVVGPVAYVTPGNAQGDLVAADQLRRARGHAVILVVWSIVVAVLAGIALDDVWLRLTSGDGTIWYDFDLFGNVATCTGEDCVYENIGDLGFNGIDQLALGSRLAVAFGIGALFSAAISVLISMSLLRRLRAAANAAATAAIMNAPNPTSFFRLRGWLHPMRRTIIMLIMTMLSIILYAAIARNGFVNANTNVFVSGTVTSLRSGFYLMLSAAVFSFVNAMTAALITKRIRQAQRASPNTTITVALLA